MYFLRKDKAPCGANAGLRLLLLRNQDDRVVVVDRASQDSLSPFRSVFLGVERAWDWVKVYIQLKLDALLFKHRRSFCREQCLINTYVNAAKDKAPCGACQVENLIGYLCVTTCAAHNALATTTPNGVTVSS